jgi:outer membrane protein assembly factor BamD (BamD/ComL family)
MHRFSLLSLTFLLSLTPTIQLDRTSLAIANASAQAQTVQNRKDEADRLYDVGTQQLNKGQYREALQPLEQALAIAKMKEQLSIILDEFIPIGETIPRR